jgi:maltose alpha-D-glucosyltransferase/alpha-amylase
MDEQYPDRILLCEANQWPEDVRAYFGDGDEFNMGFHFPLMPRVFMAIRKGERSSIEWILSRTPEIPENCQWCTFLRNHDELTLEMVTEEERQWMWQEYAPEPRMRLNLGIRRRLAPLLENNRSKLELANSLLFTLTGSPVIYYGDEIGMGDNIWLHDRDGVRTPMQWDMGMNAGFSSTDPDLLYSPVIAENPYGAERVSVSVQEEDPGSLLNLIKKMIAVHKDRKALGWGELEWLPVENRAVAAYLRRYQVETLLILNNLSGSPQSIRYELSLRNTSMPVDLLTGDPFPVLDKDWLALTLVPYQYLWLKL